MRYKLNKILTKGAKVFASRIAIEDVKGRAISYRQLNDMAFVCSDFLSKHAIGSGMRVGVVASKSIEYVACIFGIMKCEAAYVPIDINAPISRNSLVFDDCNLKAIFIENSQLKNYTNTFSKSLKFDVIVFNRVLSLILFERITPLHYNELSYILYTSGSTGTPKGVMHTHQSAWAFINWSVKKFKPLISDRFSSNAPFHFDLSVFDVFVSLSVGATLVLFDEATTNNPLLLASAISQKNISYFYATPTTLTYLCNFGKLHKYTFPYLKHVLFAGEVFLIHDLASIKAVWSSTTFYNLYGPTETNVCTYFKIPKNIPKVQSLPFPIGKACGFANIKIEKASNRKGELLVTGNSVMLGYWNDVKKTKGVFVTDKNGCKWYKTGDIVSVDHAGYYNYVGRKDRMVKRRGYRIELGEIESCLAKHQAIVHVAISVCEKSDQAKNYIIAYVVLRNKLAISETDLYQYCYSQLPEYMIPDQFKILKKMPLTSTHKIDYKTLSSLYA